MKNITISNQPVNIVYTGDVQISGKKNSVLVESYMLMHNPANDELKIKWTTPHKARILTDRQRVKTETEIKKSFIRKYSL